MTRDEIIAWLLDSDPAIRWQVLRDLAHAPAADVVAERARVAHEGWAGRLLAQQPLEGDWGDGQDFWMSTVHVLTLLRLFGIDPADRRMQASIALIQDKLRWTPLDNRPFFDGETEACINGRILSSGTYFGVRCDPLVRQLLGEQLQDGGWNCEAPPSTRSSFHSTICVLEGLLEHEQTWGADPAVTAARRRAEEYLLERRLLRGLETGRVISARWTCFTWPMNWHYDILRGLDYFHVAGASPDDPRFGEALRLVRERRHEDGRWVLDAPYNDAMPVRLPHEVEAGQPSRWVTLRAMRVLDWADGGRAA